MIKINATGDVTLRTAGKYCEDDILVKVPAPKGEGSSGGCNTQYTPVFTVNGNNTFTVSYTIE